MDEAPGVAVDLGFNVRPSEVRQLFLSYFWALLSIPAPNETEIDTGPSRARVMSVRSPATGDTFPAVVMRSL